MRWVGDHKRLLLNMIEQQIAWKRIVDTFTELHAIKYTQQSLENHAANFRKDDHIITQYLSVDGHPVIVYRKAYADGAWKQLSALSKNNY